MDSDTDLDPLALSKYLIRTKLTCTENLTKYAFLLVPVEPTNNENHVMN
jgi:hypothetical protein